jgi:tetratricopeptide (TPR) repeat protein
MDAKSVQQALKEAVQHQLAGRFPQAAAKLQRVLSAAPNNSDAWHLLGVLSLQQRDYPKAVQSLQKAISLNPALPDYHYNLAGAYFMLAQWSDAVKAYQATLQRNPTFAEAYKGLGAALKKLERFPEAIEAFQRSLELNPAQFPVYLDLADSLEAGNQISYAVQTVQLALKLEPYSAEAHQRLASLYRNLGDHLNAATAWLQPRSRPAKAEVPMKLPSKRSAKQSSSIPHIPRRCTLWPTLPDRHCRPLRMNTWSICSTNTRTASTSTSSS